MDEAIELMDEICEKDGKEQIGLVELRRFVG